LVQIKSGSPQFRIKETVDVDAPTYNFYSQSDLADDLGGIGARTSCDIEKVVRTYDKLNLLQEGDLVFSLISASAALVGKENDGKVCTQNYIILETGDSMDKGYLLYILNEDKNIKKQLQIGLQGSKVLKYSQKQVKELEICRLPDMKRQKLIGSIYLKQKKITALRHRLAMNEEKIILDILSSQHK